MLINHKNNSFSNQIVLITGGTRGIGRAVATDLLDRGARVIITGKYKRDGWWDNYQHCDFYPVDFSNSAQTNSFYTYLAQTNILFLVNCVGVFQSSNLDKTQEKEFKNLFNINYFTPTGVIKNVLPNMKKKKFGRIINISSIASILHREGSTAYSSSKAALLTTSRVLALEVAQYGITVNTVSPGYTETDMVDSLDSKMKNNLIQNVPLKRLCSTKQIANGVLFLLEPQNDYITGHNLIIDGGITLKQ